MGATKMKGNRVCEGREGKEGGVSLKEEFWFYTVVFDAVCRFVVEVAQH